MPSGENPAGEGVYQSGVHYMCTRGEHSVSGMAAVDMGMIDSGSWQECANMTYM